VGKERDNCQKPPECRRTMSQYFFGRAGGSRVREVKLVGCVVYLFLVGFMETYGTVKQTR